MPSEKHIPQGFPALVPYLTVDDPAKLIAFAQKGLGAEEMKDQRWEHPPGKVIHTALQVEGCVIEVGQSSAEWKAMPMAIHLYVQDVDAVYDRALKAGGVSLHEVREMEYDERACAVRDPCGNNWYIATHTGRPWDLALRPRSSSSDVGAASDPCWEITRSIPDLSKRDAVAGSCR